MRIAIDIDGILTNETEGVPYKDRTPNLENIFKLLDLYDAGYKIILFSARHRSDLEITREWLRKYKVKYHKLILGKVAYDFIWDDKSFDKVLDFDFRKSLCPRIIRGKVPRTEKHPCFFCGYKIIVSTPQCPICGSMPCPKCGKCYCSLRMSEKLFLYLFKTECCNKIPNSNGLPDLKGVFIPEFAKFTQGAYEFCKEKKDV